MSSVNTGVSMKVSFIAEHYAIDLYKSMAYAGDVSCDYPFNKSGGDGQDSKPRPVSGEY